MRRFGGIGFAWLVATVVAVTIAAAAVGSVRSEVTDVPTALGVSASPPLAVADSDESSDTPDEEFDREIETTSTLSPVVDVEPSESPVLGTTTTSATTTTTEPAATDPVVLAEDHTRHQEAAKSLPQAGATSTTSSTSPERPNTTSVPTTKPTTVATSTSTSTTTTTTTAPTAPTTTSTTTSTTTTTSATTTTTTIPSPKPYTRAIDTDGGSLSVRVDGDAVTFRRAFPNSGWRFDLANGGPVEVEARFTKTNDRSTRIRVLVRVINGTLDITISPSN